MIRKGGRAAAHQETATHAGKKLHDAIREVISDMEKLELDALLRLEQDTLAEARFTLSLIVLFGVMAFFFVGTAWVVIHSDLLGRRRAEAVLQHAHDDLERQVAERTREMKREYDFSKTSLVNTMRQMLMSLGYEVFGHTSSLDALEAFMNQPASRPFDLVITDMAMPGMTGLGLASELLRLSPSLPVVLCTGFSELGDMEMARKVGIREILMKPIAMSQLAEVVRKVLDESRKP